MEKIRIGIIGCGLAANNLHVPALLQLQDKFEIVKLANHTEPKAKALSEKLGGVSYVLDYKELLNDPEVDAAVVALPISLNYKAALETIKAGKHLFLEKPLAANLDEASELLSLDNYNGKIKMVAENFRYRDVYAKAKQYIGEGKIGKVYSVQWNIFYEVDKNSGYASTGWRQNNEYAGGFVTDAGVHYVAALRRMFGEFEWGISQTAGVNPEIGTHDTLNFHFRTLDGVIGNLNIYYSVKGWWEDRILIFGNNGVIEINQNKITVKEKDKTISEEDFGDDHGFVNEFEAFYKAITEEEKLYSTLREGYKDLEIVLKALESSENKKPVIFNK